MFIKDKYQQNMLILKEIGKDYAVKYIFPKNPLTGTITFVFKMQDCIYKTFLLVSAVSK